MVSKIIQKEKDRQDKIIREHTAFMGDSPEDPKPFQYKNPVMDNHKQVLINLKEYLEEQVDGVESLMKQIGFPTITENEIAWSIKNQGLLGMLTPIKQDIKELTKMIGRYE